MHELNCDLAPQRLLLYKPSCWTSESTPRAVSTTEVFLCSHRCKEESPRPRAMQKEATIVPQGCDHPPIILTPARGTHSDPPLIPSLHILPTVVRCHCTWEFHLSEYDSEYRKKPKGLWQSQINILSSPRAGAQVLTHAVTHIPDRILTRSVIWSPRSLHIMNNNKWAERKGRGLGGSW